MLHRPPVPPIEASPSLPSWPLSPIRSVHTRQKCASVSCKAQTADEAENVASRASTGDRVAGAPVPGGTRPKQKAVLFSVIFREETKRDKVTAASPQLTTPAGPSTTIQKATSWGIVTVRGATNGRPLFDSSPGPL
jgi:hypothetical protein